MKNLNRLELAMNHLQKIVGYVLMKFLICQHMKATVSCIRMTRCINRSVSKDRAFGFTGRKIMSKVNARKQYCRINYLIEPFTETHDVLCQIIHQWFYGF